MKDFLTRVAERALGTAPRIDPQVTSRYAPARLPLPEPRASEIPPRAVNSPRTSRPREVDLQQESPEKLIAPNREPMREVRERISVPDKPPRDVDLSSAENTTPPNEPESVAALVPERIVSAPFVVGDAPASQDPHSDQPSVDHSSDQFEEPQIPNRREESRPFRAPSLVEDTTNRLAKREVQKRRPKVVEPIVDESNDIAKPAQSSSTPPTEVIVETRSPAKVSQTREHQQATRPPTSPTLAAPTPPPDRRAYERTERREKSIRVKIGRVEVHAPPPPITPVEPPAAPVPKLSLAEFLRQHNRRRDE